MKSFDFSKQLSHIKIVLKIYSFMYDLLGEGQTQWNFSQNFRNIKTLFGDDKYILDLFT